MGFIEAYKRLEKLCGEMFGPERPVSAYIDEMRNTPQGSRFVKGWDDDLESLKHYRWVRNKISHEPDCTEESMCVYDDEQWLIVFYDRIMKQTDPLALYHKEIRRREEEAQRKKQEQKEVLRKQQAEQEKNTYVKVNKKTEKREKHNINRALTIIVAVLAVLLVVMLVVLRSVK